MIKFILPKGFFQLLSRQLQLFQSKSKINILVAFSFSNYQNDKYQEKNTVEIKHKKEIQSIFNKNYESNTKLKDNLFGSKKNKQQQSQNDLTSTKVLNKLNKNQKKWSQNKNFHNKSNLTKKDNKISQKSHPEKIQEIITSKSGTFLSKQKSLINQQLKPKLKWEQKQKQKSQRQIFFGSHNGKKTQNSFNNMNQKRQNYKYFFNANQSLKTNIMKCQTSQALSTIFRDYKIYFNSKMYAVGGKKLVNCFQGEIKQLRTIQQKRKVLQKLTPFIQNILSLDPMESNKYQFHTEQIKAFLHVIRKLKSEFLKYYPQNKQKLQKLIISLKKKLVELVQQFQALELITIQSDLMRIDVQLQSEQIYKQFLKKKQSYVLNYYSFTNFIFCLSYLQEYSKSNKKTILDRRNQCFQFMIEEAIKKDKLLKFQNLINVQNFYSYLENILKFKYGVPVILKLQIGNKIFEYLNKVVLNESREYYIQFNYNRLISHFSKNLECFAKLLFIFALIPKNANGESQIMKPEIIQSWIKIQNNAVSCLNEVNKVNKKTLQSFFIQYSNKMKNQHYITDSQLIDLKEFLKTIC